ncbi:MAG: 2-oxo acid dehydrogenase subunit E2 [Kofleriaceae bacterium]|nr:2-oxo acid dehydrogenase subunit E2 [Myxococcales bacterium]MCB9564550.1 2-oxo acid dehydrogenase subunit E2 [Kofleriaceae bacterium]
MGNLELERKSNPSTFRKLAIGTWDNAAEASVYGSLTLRMEPALAYLAAFRAATGRHATVTHLMGRAMAEALRRMPDANALLRARRVYLRKRVSVFFQVAMEDPATGELDLSGTVLRDADQKSLAECVDECNARFAKVKAHKDRELEGTRSLLSRLPGPLVGSMLRATSFLSYELNLDLRRLGIPRDAFGSVMITNIGSIGLQEAYVPLIAYSRVPMILALGNVEDVPVVDDGELVAGKTMKVCATFDHRLLDGSHAVVIARTLREWFAHPFDHFDPVPRP